ncbi:hypothetical protein [Gordonia soli]|uniref:Mce-associated membrane protein n=1 Tax=Gordonia soli NBRC 108243 TaxID=1223545 RepID=M0QIQ3_9ACTN|nr:hypothetical protein [Gordonia soli]GAC68500.1 hypothetical protein GS4_16_00300 [Gordonia soli NBRC 108243]
MADPDKERAEQSESPEPLRKEVDAMSTVTTKSATTENPAESDHQGPTEDDAVTGSPANESVDTAQSTGTTGRWKAFAGRSISTRAVLVAGVTVVVVAVIGVLGWQLAAAKSEVSDLNAASSDRQQAEKVALDYATGAAQMSYENPADWRTRLTKGTTPELGDRLEKASTSMEQLIKPLQWSSTAEPIAAKVESDAGGVYQVQAFVNVFTKNAQAPDGIESTATYKMTIDKNNDWVITDISGIGSSFGGQQGPR